MFKQLHARLVKQGPEFLRFPLKIVPFAVQRQFLERLLQWQFTQALEDGELDFLEDRWLKIVVTDLELCWFMSVKDDKLIVSQREREDVSFSGCANDLILIAARKEDPDTLFFQRRLMIEGDTELGLYVKNLMDAIELESMPAPLRIGLLRLADFVEAGLKNQPEQNNQSASSPC